MFCFTYTHTNRFILVNSVWVLLTTSSQLIANLSPLLRVCTHPLQTYCLIFPLPWQPASRIAFPLRHKRRKWHTSQFERIFKSCKLFSGYKNILRAEQNLIEEIFFLLTCRQRTRPLCTHSRKVLCFGHIFLSMWWLFLQCISFGFTSPAFSNVNTYVSKILLKKGHYCLEQITTLFPLFPFFITRTILRQNSSMKQILWLGRKIKWRGG